MRIETQLYGELTLLTNCPLVGAVETISFITAITESFNGKEDREPLRDTPKQSIQLSYFASTDFFDVEYKDIRKKWAVPFNQELQFVGDISNGATSIACNTSISDFRSNSLAILRNNNSFQVVEIATKGEGVLNLLNPCNAMQNATIAPLRVCIIVGDIDRSFKTTYQSSKVTFNVIDTIELQEELPSLTYKGRDLYFPTLWAENGELATTIRKQQDLIDYDIGLFESRSHHLNSRVFKNWNFKTQDRLELFNFKKFLFRRLGMFREFYMPTYEKNLKLKSTGLITNRIDVERTDYIDRKNIAISVNGVWQAVEIATITQLNATTTRLNFLEPVSIQASNIERISYLGLYRLNSDSAEINYNGNGFATISLPLVELE